jgi:hypothetical protein
MDAQMCPLRKRVVIDLTVKDAKGIQSKGTWDEFLPCIREKCAWWLVNGDSGACCVPVHAVVDARSKP